MLSDNKNENDVEANGPDEIIETEQTIDAVVVEVDSEAPSPAEDAEPIEEEAPQESVAKTESSGRSAGILAMVAGGAIAGAIGFGAATVLNFGSNDQSVVLIEELNGQIALQTAQIEGLAADVSRVEGLTDVSDLAEQFAQLSAEANTQQDLAGLPSKLDALATAVAELEARLLTVEKRPMAEAISEGAIEAYEQEMAGLRVAIAEHRADIEAMAAEAREMEASARAEAIKSEGTGWLTDISVAIANGLPFDESLDDLRNEGVTISEVLTASAADGVATQAELADEFPASARAALNAVRSAESDGATGSIMTFLQNQLGARSLSPKDGDSADAILSRAEAAVKSGTITVALSELEALPEAGIPAMAEWVDKATQLISVQAAQDALKEQIVNK